jgi:predicted transcriptional regulator
MTQIAISDEVASSLASAAASRGCDPTVLASFLLEQALREQEEVELTPELESLLLERIRQSEQGELITSEEVDAKFEAFFRELDAR